MLAQRMPTRQLFDGLLLYILHCKIHKVRCILNHALYAKEFKALGRALHSLVVSLVSPRKLLRSRTSSRFAQEHSMWVSPGVPTGEHGVPTSEHPPPPLGIMLT